MVRVRVSDRKKGEKSVRAGKKTVFRRYSGSQLRVSSCPPMVPRFPQEGCLEKNYM